MKIFYILLFCILLPLISFSQQTFITRGFQPDEIFISSIWYINEQTDERYDAVFYSSDNGKSIGIRYYTCTFDMVVGNLITDKTPDVIYNYWWRDLWITEDGAFSWNQITAPGNYSNSFAAGNKEGEIYLFNNEYGLFKSTDYGQNFNLINADQNAGNVEIGTEPDEVYLLSYTDPLRIFYSNDGGTSFDLQNEIDTIIGGHPIVGNYQMISRGASPGELYFVSWHKPDFIHIYYSSDYGETFDLRYISPSMDPLYLYSYSAGIDSGSFYIKYTVPLMKGNMDLHILYSNDTAKTFREYIHHLTPDFPVYADQISGIDSEFICYPNPFSDKTRLKFKAINSEGTSIGIYTIEGKLLREIQASRMQHYVVWNGCDAAGKEVPPGIYLVKLTDAQYSKTQKIVKR